MQKKSLQVLCYTDYKSFNDIVLGVCSNGQMHIS